MGAFIAPATLEQIRAASDIVDVISAVVPLKRAGANFVGLCPFHREKSPSFNVNPRNQFFHCFGCHKHGDVFTFVKEYESVDFPDAVRRLAERARIPLEFDQQAGQAQNRQIKDQLLAIHEQITQRWQAFLENDAGGQIARDYLTRRGVAPDAVKLFRLGCAPDAWDDTVNWAKSKGFDLPLVEQSGLIIRKEGADHYYDRFRGRLMFPICDEQGRVIAFSGRTLGDDKAKYVNSPETPIFTKGKVMFGLDKSKRAMLDASSAVICEGQLDLIACFMAGVKNIVAPQGTALTSDHTRLLKRYVKEVVLCFDSDNAGQNAAVRSLDSLLASGLAIRVATVSAPHDPDSYIKEFGGPAFAKLIAEARGFFDYYLDRLCALHNPETDRGRQAITHEMGEALRKTGSDVLVDTYAQKTALRLAVAADAVRAAFQKAARAQPFRDAGPDEPEPPVAEEAAPLERPPETECWLMRIALESDDHTDWIAQHLQLEWLTHEAVRSVLSQRLQAHAAGTWRGAAAWLSENEQPAWTGLVTEILAGNRAIADPAAILQGSATRAGAVRILRDKYLERQLALLQGRLASPDLSDAEQTSLLQQMNQLRQAKRRPLASRDAAEPG